MTLTNHAIQRCAQRHIAPDALAFIKKHARKIRRTGITFYFLGKRNIPKHLRRNDRYARLEGITLLISPDGSLITTYRNPDGLKTIRKKLKYRMCNASFKAMPCAF